MDFYYDPTDLGKFGEIGEEDPELAEKRQTVVINKIDLPNVRENLVEVLPYFKEKGINVFPISAATGEGIPDLLDDIAFNLWGKPDETW